MRHSSLDTGNNSLYHVTFSWTCAWFHIARVAARLLLVAERIGLSTVLRHWSWWKSVLVANYLAGKMSVGLMTDGATSGGLMLGGLI